MRYSDSDHERMILWMGPEPHRTKTRHNLTRSTTSAAEVLSQTDPRGSATESHNLRRSEGLGSQMQSIKPPSATFISLCILATIAIRSDKNLLTVMLQDNHCFYSYHVCRCHCSYHCWCCYGYYCKVMLVMTIRFCRKKLADNAKL